MTHMNPARILYALLLPVLLFSCASRPTANAPRPAGSLQVHLLIKQPAALARTAAASQTTWSKICVAIDAPDMQPVEHVFTATPAKGWENLTVSALPAGNDRQITVWTVNAANDTIHGPVSSTVDIAPSATASIALELSPVAGSIYISLTGLHPSIDSVIASFSTAERHWQVRSASKARLFLSLDNIPYGSTGIFSIAGLTLAGDTVVVSVDSAFHFSATMSSATVSFVNTGSATLSIELTAPMVTAISGLFHPSDSLEPERGGLIISEILWAANDSEYIEVYNPASAEDFNDTFFVQIDTGPLLRFVAHILPGDFFVVGRNAAHDLPWVDACPGSSAALNLSSTDGNWITLRAKDSTVMDRVSYECVKSVQQWPAVSGKQSIVLNALTHDPLYNNFGMHWQAAQTLIDKDAAEPLTLQQGTPGSAGL